MAAASNKKCDARIQNKIISIEPKLKKIFSEQGNSDGELFFKRISKKPGRKVIFPLRFVTSGRNKLKNGIYLIHLNLEGNASHGILLFVSQDINGQYIFNLFEPNGQRLANEPTFYQLELTLDENEQNINTTLSPTMNINGNGNCGIWGIVMSILLNGLINNEITNVEKDNFYRFLNENKTNGDNFARHISDTYFNSDRQIDVNLFREDIINMIKNVDVGNLSEDERAAEEREGGKKIKTKKKKSIKKGKKVKKGKKRKKTKKY
jgi:hypothetical protein